MEHPKIIQGGMGVAVSSWKLAKAVSSQGALGVVSGTALDIVLARRLQQGDTDGSARRALAAFPDAGTAERILSDWFNIEGTEDSHDFKQVPLRTLGDSSLDALTAAGNFVEVFLAKEGHSGAVGINFLEKIQLPNPAAIYGAMLAGVDYVLMGAGIPLEIPGLLDSYSRGEGGEISVQIEGAEKGERHVVRFEPSSILKNPPKTMKRPYFLSIVSSYILAATMASRATGRVDGIVVENHLAGGHNAPPRGVLSVDENGEPIYGPKDTVDYAKMVGLSIPFWLGGSYSMEESLEKAGTEGAWGIQVGTLFAFCRESGVLPELKKRFLEAVAAGKEAVFTHPLASPTGYPFKFAVLRETLSEKVEMVKRIRVCNIGLLRQLYKTPEGKIGYRCPAENEEAFARKGGDRSLSSEARCLCNALMANVGLGMKYAGGYLEKPLLTVASQLESLRRLIRKAGFDYTAADVVRFLSARPAKAAE